MLSLIPWNTMRKNWPSYLIEERAIHLTILEYGWHKNDYLSTRAHTFFICMTRAKVKLIWIAARTGAKRGLLSTRTLYSYKLSYFIKQVIIFYLRRNSETQYSSYPQSGKRYFGTIQWMLFSVRWGFSKRVLVLIVSFHMIIRKLKRSKES